MAIQIIITVFVLFAVSRILIQFKKQNVGAIGLLFWMLVWATALVIVYWPGLVHNISNWFGIGRAIDFLIYFGLLIGFYLIYRLYIKIVELEQSITKIVRSNALKDLDK
jgi:small membrane protein